MRLHVTILWWLFIAVLPLMSRSRLEAIADNEMLLQTGGTGHYGCSMLLPTC